MIKFEGYFGDHKSISFYEDGQIKGKVWELRWNDGRRMLLGGNKNGQSKDITKAKSIYLKATKNTAEEEDC